MNIGKYTNFSSQWCVNQKTYGYIIGLYSYVLYTRWIGDSDGIRFIYLLLQLNMSLRNRFLVCKTLTYLLNYTYTYAIKTSDLWVGIISLFLWSLGVSDFCHEWTCPYRHFIVLWKTLRWNHRASSIYTYLARISTRKKNGEVIIFIIFRWENWDKLQDCNRNYLPQK